MKRVFFFGAIDRFNYGDLLLPVILKDKLRTIFSEKELEIRIFGTIESDLSAFGALPTESLSVFYQAMKTIPSHILLVGGEVLTPSWSTVYSHLNLPMNRWYELTKKIRRINSPIARSLLRGRGRRPFILNITKYPLVQSIMYNAVGGKRRGKYKRTDFRNLKEANFLSCRDASVLSVLRKNLHTAELAPDSAIQMSELYSKDKLQTLISLEMSKLMKESYVFFQVSNAVSLELGVDALAMKLRALAEKHQKNIVLCPIGTASGHEDDIALQAIKVVLPEARFILVKNPTIWDIMGLIANASLYIGGSLHGIITAMSFEVPYLFLRDRPKLVAYVETWGVEALKGATSLDNWDHRIEAAYQLNPLSLKESLRYQLEISEKAFQKMINPIKG